MTPVAANASRKMLSGDGAIELSAIKTFVLAETNTSLASPVSYTQLSVIMSPALIACEVATSVRVEVFCTLMLSFIKRTLPPTNRYAGALMSSIGYCFIYCLCWF